MHSSFINLKALMLSEVYLLLVPEVVSLAEDEVSLSNASSFTNSIVLL